MSTTITTISSRDLNLDVGRAKKAAAKGPVFITSRGKPVNVLLSIQDYQRLTKQHRNIVDALAMVDDVAFEPQRMDLTPQVPEWL